MYFSFRFTKEMTSKKYWIYLYINLAKKLSGIFRQRLIAIEDLKRQCAFSKKKRYNRSDFGLNAQKTSSLSPKNFLSLILQISWRSHYPALIFS